MEENADNGCVPNWNLGTALQLLRTVAGWSQDDLAKASGVRGSSISDYERGKIVPGLKTLQRLLRAEGYPLAVLDHALTFIDILRSEQSLGLAAEKDIQTGAPPASRLFFDSAAYRQQVEEVAASAANVVGRMVRLHFAARYHQSMPLREEPTPAADPAVATEGEQGVAT